MTENNAQILVSNIEDDQSYCTRDVDGVSGMTVSALAGDTRSVMPEAYRFPGN